jgi:hypothetical protein
MTEIDLTQCGGWNPEVRVPHGWVRTLFQGGGSHLLPVASHSRKESELPMWALLVRALVGFHLHDLIISNHHTGD